MEGRTHEKNSDEKIPTKRIRRNKFRVEEKMPEKNILGWLEELQLNFLIENTKRFEKEKVEPMLCKRLKKQKTILV